MATGASGNPPDREQERVLQVLRRALSGEPPPPGEENPGKVWIEGTDEQGMVVIGVQLDDSQYRVRVPDLPTLAAMVGARLRPRRGATDLKLPFTGRTAPVLPILEHPLDPATPVRLLRAGAAAQHMEAIESAVGRFGSAALYTCRGPTVDRQGMEYKPINEDGVALWVQGGDPASGRPEIVAIGAFDQAGGEGSVEGQSGAASEAAARCFLDAMESIRTGTAPEQALQESVSRASQAVRELGVGAVSTFAAVVVVCTEAAGVPSRKAYAISVGDSRVLLVGKDGAVRQKTELHNLGAKVAAGQVPEIPSFLAIRFAGALSRGLGTPDDTPDLQVWDLEPGDKLVAETDGVGDARELEESPLGTWHADHSAVDQGRILAHVRSASEAVLAITAYALDQMADRYGKPDNIGLAVIDIR